MRRLRGPARFFRCQMGVTAIEFALLLPVFLFLLFGILEICFVLLFSLMLTWGADRGVEYLEQQRQHYRPIDAVTFRLALCSALGGLPLACDAKHLKIALIKQDNPTSPAAEVKYPIADRFDDPNGGIYLLALGYEWNFVFPTAGFVLPYSGPNTQLQTTAIAVLAERVTEFATP